MCLGGCGSPDEHTTQVSVPDKAVQSEDVDEDLYEQGVVLLRQGRSKQAIVSLRQQIEVHPKDVRSYLVLGRIHMDAGEYRKAQRRLEEAVALFPNNPKLHFLLAESYNEMRQTERALESAQQSLVFYQRQRDQVNFEKAAAFARTLKEKLEKAKEEQKTWGSR